MSATEMDFLNRLSGVIFYLTIFGVPIVVLFLRKLGLRLPWWLCFGVSVIGVFVALQIWFITLQDPLGDAQRATLPLNDDGRLADTGEGAAVLFLGLPFGFLTTGLVFGAAAFLNWRKK